MKFILDLCVASKSLQVRLAALGQEVVTVGDLNPRASDAEILRAAQAGGAILVTEDKDFGELIHVRRQAHGVVVRLVGLSVDDQVAAVEDLIIRDSGQLCGSALITVSRDRVRIRRS